jgi:hypothetical protein
MVATMERKIAGDEGDEEESQCLFIFQITY